MEEKAAERNREKQKPRNRENDRKKLDGSKESAYGFESALSAAQLSAAVQGFLGGKASAESIGAAALLGNQAVLGLAKMGSQEERFASSAAAVLTGGGFAGFAETLPENDAGGLNGLNAAGRALGGAQTPEFAADSPSADFGGVMAAGEIYMN